MADTSPLLPEQADLLTVNFRGRDWSLDPAALDDWELLEDLGAGNGVKAPSALRRLLGDKLYEDAKELLRDERTGRVSATSMSDFMIGMFTQLKANAEDDNDSGNR